MVIRLKSALDEASEADGIRVLVDRQLPEGMDETGLQLAAWLPHLGPSVELSRWFQQRPRQWPVFRRRYLAELCMQEASMALNGLYALAASDLTTTLLTAWKDEEHNHAAVLRDLLEGMKKPPATTGPVRAAAGGRMRARRFR